MNHSRHIFLAILLTSLCGCGITTPVNELPLATPTTSERSTLTILVNPREPLNRNSKTNEFVIFLDFGLKDGTSEKVEQVLAIDPSFKMMTELEHEWYENRSKAKAKYQGQRVRLVGQPHDIVQPDQDSKALLTLDYSYNQRVLCEFTDTSRLDEVSFKTYWNYAAIEGTWSGDYLGRYTDCKILQLELKDFTEIPNP